jgi:hypothetical protein
MMINYQVVALFICCISEDLITYYNPFQFLKKEFPDVKDHYIAALLESFRKDQVGYIVQYKKLLESEPNDSIYKMLNILEPVVQSYAYQMDHPGFTRGILFKFDKYFGEYK